LEGLDVRVELGLLLVWWLSAREGRWLLAWVELVLRLSCGERWLEVSLREREVGHALVRQVFVLRAMCRLNDWWLGLSWRWEDHDLVLG